MHLLQASDKLLLHVTVKSTSACLTHILSVQLPEDKRKKILDKAYGAMQHWLERFDTVIIGPGLGRDEMVHQVVIQVQYLLDIMIASALVRLVLITRCKSKQC